MNHLKGIALAAVAAAFPLGANALSFNVLDVSTNFAGNQAATFAPEYGAFLPGTASWIVAPGTVNPPPGNNTNAFRSPFSHTVLQDVNTYFVVQPNRDTVDPVNPPTNDPAKLGLGGLKNMFTFLWGSIDIENRIEFFRAGTSIGSFTGTDVAVSTGNPLVNGGRLNGCVNAANNGNSFACVAEVSFTDSTGFDEVWFHGGTDDGDPRNSFEFAMVPLPAAAWMLLGVAGGLIAAKRRSSARKLA